MSAGNIRIGLISDTHGLLRPEALDFLEGSDHIVHAGDIGNEAILERLAQIAPLLVVRGNNDFGDWAEAIAEGATLEAGGVRLYAIHDLHRLRTDPQADGVQVVVSGHTHAPRVETRDGVLYVNPGSAGPRRFSLPVSVGEVLIRNGEATARLVGLGPYRA